MKIKQLLSNYSIIILGLILINSESIAQTPMAVAGTANKIASTSGNWSNASTWGGTLPTHDDRVLIPSGIAVTIDGMIAEEFKSVRIADGGTLKFASNVNTELRTEYLFSFNDGYLRNWNCKQ